jgi:hypothetical protein
MAHACNPSYLEGQLWFKASLVKKFKRPHLNQWLDTVMHAHLSSQLFRETQRGGSWFRMAWT